MNTMSGNLLDTPQGIIVHGCNAQGVMASGVAKDIRAAWPHAFTAYRKAYDERGLRMGEVIWVKAQDTPLLMIANAITQEYYGRDPNRVYVSYEALEKAFQSIGDAARKYQMEVNYPKIGAGLANGDWAIIEPIINRALDGVNHRLWVPAGPPAMPKMGR